VQVRGDQGWGRCGERSGPRGEREDGRPAARRAAGRPVRSRGPAT